MKNLTTSKTLDRKASTVYQQNLIEMVGYIYTEPARHCKESLAHEFMKNGKESERKIIRMVNSINALYPCIKRALNFDDMRIYYYINEAEFSEKILDTLYEKTQTAPLLYIFLKSFFVKPMTTSEIIEKVGTDRKTANKMISKILEATHHVDAIEKGGETIIGEYWEHISKLQEEAA